MKNLKNFLPQLLERCLAIMAFYFPFIEVSAYFGPKVFLSTEGLKAVGPKAFGFDIEFKSIFKNE